ncbi:hypothetical protein ATO12_24435 [Aquimarina atlantica]|uniref:DUF3887 domain-containing protein n=1 Tax=Aquimarina atlantica TaxID=1317122 RepID=A0A023BQA0_9FLAO|nr:DUF3887 domain-containing protein [Aquimarina atlantica]EZH72089.1 hypothetical protein ATO12_24435 [Aquimarina atlantica]
MKYLILLFTCFTIQYGVAQDASTYESTTKTFLENFNAQDVNAIFEMYTLEMQESMTKEGVSNFINGCYGQFGNMKNITFVETAEGVYSYKVTFDKATLGMDLQLNADGKISTIQFQEL